MKASGYDTSDARYLTLLQILKKHTQHGDFATRTQINNQPAQAYPSTPTANGNSTPAPQSRV